MYYITVGYLSDPHKTRSLSGYVFTYGGTAILWRSIKQTLTATLSNYAELITLYDAGRECVGLRSMIQHIQEEYGLKSVRENLISILSLLRLYHYHHQHIQHIQHIHDTNFYLYVGETSCMVI
jgi:hypothetical protein